MKNKKISRRKFLGNCATGLAGLSLASLISTCSGSKEQRNAGFKYTPFTMQSAWVNDAEFMGYFIAIDNDYYKNEGLDLTYLSGGPDIIPEGLLLSGRADLTMTTPDTTVNLILKENVNFKIIGTQYQKSPLGVVSLAKSNIYEPKDLIGKTLAVPPVNVISVEAMLKINGIPKEKVKIVPYQYDPTPLIMGKVDATVDFTTNVPYTIKSKGEEVNSFLLYDYGFTIYNDTIVVLEETLRKKREAITKWMRASQKGWKENFVDLEKYPPKFKNTWFKDTGRTIENEIYFNRAQKPLIEHPEGIFTMTEEGIEKNIKALNEIGLLATKDMFVTDILNEL